MDMPEPTTPVIAGGAVVLVALFVAREIAAGTLRAAGGDLWEWIKRAARRRARGGRAPGRLHKRHSALGCKGAEEMGDSAVRETRG
jgi:hypothetical protein